MVLLFTYTLTNLQCDTRREKMGALYSAVSDLLAVISRAYLRFLFVYNGMYMYNPSSSVVHVQCTYGTYSTCECRLPKQGKATNLNPLLQKEKRLLSA